MLKPAARTVAIALLSVSPALAPALASEIGGTMETVIEGRTVQLPTVNTDVSARIDGDLASVTVRQVFENPGEVPLDATYLFPLNEDAAVHAMTMRVGDEVVRAVIERKKEAIETFTAAKAEGKAAALLSQHRPNMFTQQVANLMPGLPVTVEITYAQTVPRIDDAYELVIPTVVGPRYTPMAPDTPERTIEDEHADEADAMDAATPGEWTFGPPPAYPEAYGLTIPEDIAPDRLSVSASLRAGTPIARVTSATHELRVEKGEGERTVTLAGGRTIPNRDFVLRYALTGPAPQAGLLTHVDERGGFFSLLIEPPTDAPEANVTPREVVFVLDTSGSMGGQPMDASKAFMQAALKGLRPDDAFRIVQFNSSPAEFSRGAVEATPANKRAASAYVRGLRAGGGTEVVPAIEQAFSLPARQGRMRIVVFLSDGYIGNEAQVLGQLSRQMGDARVYAFGVGTSVNRYLLEEMARRGRGTARYVDPTEEGHEAAEALARRIDAPLLTDIEVDWGTLGVTDVTPLPIPDLFAGEAVRLTGRFGPEAVANGGAAVVKVRGEVAGREATLPVAIDLAAADEASAIPVIWARGQVGDLMADLTTPHGMRRTGQSDADIEARITELGLGFDLVTQFTSFVAVSERVVNENPADAEAAEVALARPAGVPATAYPEASFGGASAPEPGLIGMLTVMLGVAGIAARRRRTVVAT